MGVIEVKKDFFSVLTKNWTNLSAEVFDTILHLDTKLLGTFSNLIILVNLILLYIQYTTCDVSCFANRMYMLKLNDLIHTVGDLI